MTHSPQPPFLVYVMWHPDSDDAAPVADRIRKHFQSPRFRHVAGGETMEVLFRSARSPDEPPFDVAWDATCPVAIVVMIDDAVAGDAEWVRYVRSLGERAEREGLRARMIPVLMEPSVLDRISLDEQALRWDRWNDATEERTARLLRNLTYEFSRMLRHHLDHPTPERGCQRARAIPRQGPGFPEPLEARRARLGSGHRDPPLAERKYCPFELS